MQPQILSKIQKIERLQIKLIKWAREDLHNYSWINSFAIAQKYNDGINNIWFIRVYLFRENKVVYLLKK